MLKGSAPRYPPAMQHSQTMQNLPPTGPVPPQTNWSNTIPTRSRGRGRIRTEESEAPPVFRPVTPDQYSAPSSRSHTPSQEYMNRYINLKSKALGTKLSLANINFQCIIVGHTIGAEVIVPCTQVWRV